LTPGGYLPGMSFPSISGFYNLKDNSAAILPWPFSSNTGAIVYEAVPKLQFLEQLP
jgi:hypothetical protein